MKTPRFYPPGLTRRGCLSHLGIAGLTVLLTGCESWRLWRRHESSPSGGECDVRNCSEQPIPRFITITDRSPIGVVNDRTLFTQELVAALNELPYCEAALLPPNAPLPSVLQTSGTGIPPWEQPVMESGPSLGLDEIWIVQVTEIQPFRPMRLCASIECRQASDGMIIRRLVRTWNAPVDDEPMAPSHFNAKILFRPPPRAVVEHHELSRLSPRTFFRNVAQEVAIELTAPPLPAEAS